MKQSELECFTERISNSSLVSDLTYNNNVLRYAKGIERETRRETMLITLHLQSLEAP